MHFFKDAHYDFMTVRRKVIIVSVALIVVGLVSVAVHRGFNTSIDFAGGTLVEVGFDQPVPISEIRAIVNQTGYSGAEITRFGAENDVLIKVKHIGDAADAARTIEAALKERMTSHTVDIRRVESVGPKIGSELQKNAFWAIVYSCLGILAYVSWRFDFRMAVAAIIALVHDVLFTLGFFSLTGREISIPVIAALLTIVGYSLNDTIVVFDRIRENMQSRRREGFMSMINTSVNETLSRTIITALTTLFAVVVLIIFGGAVIRDFALTLFVGIAIGTYSSIFIASSALVEWDQWRARHRKRA